MSNVCSGSGYFPIRFTQPASYNFNKYVQGDKITFKYKDTIDTIAKGFYEEAWINSGEYIIKIHYPKRLRGNRMVVDERDVIGKW